MTDRLAEALEGVTRVPGVRGAMLVSGDDGLVVSERAMEGVDAPAVAALAASLVARLAGATASAGRGQPAFVHAQNSEGALLLLVAGELLLVAVAAADVNVGLVRLELQQAAELL